MLKYGYDFEPSANLVYLILFYILQVVITNITVTIRYKLITQVFLLVEIRDSYNCTITRTCTQHLYGLARFAV